MKKQSVIFTMALMPLIFFSCRKDNVNENISSSDAIMEKDASDYSSEGRPYIDPLSIGLEGWFKFDANLNDATGKLPKGISTKRVAAFTNNRKGIFNTALKLDGTYGVKLTKVPQQTKTSLSVWVRWSSRDQIGGIIHGNSQGPFITQENDKYVGAVIVSPPGGINITTALYKNLNDFSWHHLVITYDGSLMKYYVDNNLIGSSSMSAAISPTLVDYLVGIFNGGNVFWNGSIDDLRFYSRALTATDIQKLFNQ